MSDYSTDDDGLNVAGSLRDIDEDGTILPGAARSAGASLNSDGTQRRRRRTKEEMEAARAAGGGDVHQLFPPTRAIPKQKAKRNLEGITASLQFLHTAIAMRTNMPELVISPEEAHMLADAGAGLLEYYKIKLDGKAGAAASLMYAITAVYGPRIFAIVMKERAKKKEPENNGAPNIS